MIAAAGLAIAQTAATRHKLHEDLPAPSERPTPMIGGGGSGNPAAFAAGDKVLPKPPADKPSSTPPKDEPVLGTTSFAADRQTSMKPDGNTGPDSTLHYVSVFNPTWRYGSCAAGERDSTFRWCTRSSSSPATQWRSSTGPRIP